MVSSHLKRNVPYKLVYVSKLIIYYNKTDNIQPLRCQRYTYEIAHFSF